MEPLQAEANALLLGAKLARALNLQRANLITDNEVLAKTAQAIGHCDLFLLNLQMWHME